MAEKLNISPTGTGPSTINKNKAASSVTWVSLPILTKDNQLKTLNEGLIPNDLIIKIRVDNPYGPSSRFNIENHNMCEVENDYPVYEFAFDKVPKFPDDIPDDNVIPVSIQNNPVSVNSDLTLELCNLPENCNIYIRDARGNIMHALKSSDGSEKQFLGSGVNARTFQLQNSTYKSGLYYIQVVDPTSGKNIILKWVLI